jgi:hypothetical protein
MISGILGGGFGNGGKSKELKSKLNLPKSYFIGGLSLNREKGFSNSIMALDSSPLSSG